MSEEFSLVFTNVPGPQIPIKYNGHPSKKVYFFMLAGGYCGLGISVYSHNGLVKFGITGDEAKVKDPSSIVTLFDKKVKEALDADLSR